MKRSETDQTVALIRAQLDRYFSQLKKYLRPVPAKGWIAEIREALLMTTGQLAKRMGVPQSNVSIFEKAERNKKITLESLERAATALECELCYFFVPKEGLNATLKTRAQKLYERDEKILERHMRLEGQGTRGDISRADKKTLLLFKQGKRLWVDLD